MAWRSVFPNEKAGSYSLGKKPSLCMDQGPIGLGAVAMASNCDICTNNLIIAESPFISTSPKRGDAISHHRSVT